MPQPLLAALFGYALGSVPVAWLIVRRASDVDIRRAGSGNVGALNSYEVTRSPRVGAMVLLLDVLKGVLAVLGSAALFGDETAPLSAAAAVAGHNFPVWLGFRGGRGLATGAGAMAFLAWPLLALWLLLWAAARPLLRDVNAANAAATGLSMAAVLAAPEILLGPDAWTDNGALPLGYGAVLMLLLILARLAGPVRDHFRGRKNSLEGRKDA